MDVGQRQQAEIDKLSPAHNEAHQKLKETQQRITDLELAQKGDDQKRAKIGKELFGGKVINPREVANLEKEIEIIKRKQDVEADSLLELYDELPPLRKAFDELAAKMNKLVAERDEKRKAAVAEKAKIESTFKELSSRRPEATKGISAGLLARYDNIRQHHGGVGMVEIIKKTGNCGGCGTHLPERTVSLLKDDKIALCESCHRLLYFTEGVV